MKRKLLSLLLALGVVLSVSACTDSGSSVSTAGAEAAASAVVTEAAAPETTAPGSFHLRRSGGSLCSGRFFFDGGVRGIRSGSRTGHRVSRYRYRSGRS